MQPKHARPAPGANRADRKFKTKYFRHPNHTTGQTVSNQKLHWSRRPEQRWEDKALLALLGLAFKPVPSLGGKGAI